MIADVIVPDELWEGNEGTLEGVISTWLADDGARVRQGDLIAEFMLQKVTVEIHAPASGRLRTLTKPNEVVHKGEVVARIE